MRGDRPDPECRELAHHRLDPVAVDLEPHDVTGPLEVVHAVERGERARVVCQLGGDRRAGEVAQLAEAAGLDDGATPDDGDAIGDRKSTRLNSSHVKISYAVFCLKKKNKNE